jgi:AhpD family alkylhydroperoxidase
MTGHTRIPRARLTGFYGAIVKRMSRKMRGEVADPVELAWHNRRVLNFSFAIGRHTQKWDQCDENLKSFGRLAAAGMIGCSFCLDSGYFQARNNGLDMVKAGEVPRWRESEAETTTPPEATDELSARLLAALGAAALVELTMHIAVANLTARGNTALGITSQGFADSCVVSPA